MKSGAGYHHLISANLAAEARVSVVHALGPVLAGESGQGEGRHPVNGIIHAGRPSDTLSGVDIGDNIV